MSTQTSYTYVSCTTQVDTLRSRLSSGMDMPFSLLARRQSSVDSGCNDGQRKREDLTMQLTDA